MEDQVINKDANHSLHSRTRKTYKDKITKYIKNRKKDTKSPKSSQVNYDNKFSIFCNFLCFDEYR